MYRHTWRSELGNLQARLPGQINGTISTREPDFTQRANEWRPPDIMSIVPKPRRLVTDWYSLIVSDLLALLHLFQGCQNSMR